MATLAPRNTLDRQLSQLKQDILVLGSIVEQAVLQAVEALKKRDLAAAKRIYAGDQRVNDKRFEIEQAALALIATQQPIARDLRVLASILEINTELERMGDYAKGIARITLEMSRRMPVKFPDEISQMAACSADMLHRALTAFQGLDVDAARAIPAEDTVVDDLYNQVNRALIKRIGENPGLIDGANYLMWAAHNLERMADRVTNICERTVFIATGKLIELNTRNDEMQFI